MRHRLALWAVLLALTSVSHTRISFGEELEAPEEAPEKPVDPIVSMLDIPYAGTENTRQQLDIYLPREPVDEKPLPVVIIIHGTFQNPDRKSGIGLAQALVPGGELAAVAVGYRLSDEAIWPAQIHDCKAAVRWVRANAKQYNLDPEKIGVIGPSGGGHLAALLGTTGGVPELEGKLGDYLDTSSRGRCVVDLFGPTDLTTLGTRHDRPNSPESRLLGGPLPEKRELAKQASAISYITADDPPMLVIHGTKDPVIPFQQSERFVAALKQAKVDGTLIRVEGGLHGNFKTLEVANRFYQFFIKHLKGADVEISTDPIQIPPKEPAPAS